MYFLINKMYSVRVPTLKVCVENQMGYYVQRSEHHAWNTKSTKQILVTIITGEKDHF